MSKRELNPLFQKINQGVKLAIKKEIDKHRKLNQAISIYQDGKIITLRGQEISKILDSNSQ